MCLKSEGKEFLYKRENTEDKVRTLRDRDREESEGFAHDFEYSYTSVLFIF